MQLEQFKNIIKNVLSSKALQIFLIFFYLIISMVYFDFLDWKIEIATLTQMYEGIPYFDIKGVYINNVSVGYHPYHPPVFFIIMYIISLIFGLHNFVIRFFLWLSTMALAFLLGNSYEYDPAKKRIMTNLFLLFPVLIGVNFLGQFDQIMLLFLMIGIFLILRKNQSVLGGLLIGLAIMTKVIAIIAVPILLFGLISKQKLVEVLKVSLGVFLSAGSIFFYNYWMYNTKFINLVFTWQINRGVETNTAISLLHFDFTGVIWFIIQISILATFALVLLYFMYRGNYGTIYLSISTIFIVYLFIARTVFAHYFLWVFVTAYPGLNHLIETNHRKIISFWWIFVILSATGSALSITFNDHLPSFTLIELIGTIVMNISMCILLVLSFWLIYISSKIENIETKNLITNIIMKSTTNI